MSDRAVPPLPPARRAGRWLLIAHAVVLTVATHWPELRVGTPESPAPDKLVHWVAFGLLALLMWFARWPRRLVAFAVVALLWPIADELTQALPFLGRQFTMIDVIAGELGVIAVLAWRAAMLPSGSGAPRERQERFARAVDRVWAERRETMKVILAGAAGGVLGAAAAAIAAIGETPAVIFLRVVCGSAIGAVAAGAGVLALLARADVAAGDPADHPPRPLAPLVGIALAVIAITVIAHIAAAESAPDLRLAISLTVFALGAALAARVVRRQG